MTPTIEALARECGFMDAADFRRERGQAMCTPEQDAYDRLARFAGLVRAAAMEEAIKVCDSVSHDNPLTANDCAEAMRALKEPRA